MPQSKRFGKRLSSLVNVTAFSTRSRQNVGAMSFLVLAVGGVPTAAQALDITFKVNNAPITITGLVQPVNTPGTSEDICSLAPCTGSKGKVVTLNIPAGLYGAAPNQLQVLAGARAEAKIETNATKIGDSSTTIASTSIINTLNVVGTFRYVSTGTPVNPGKIEIVVSSDFNLRSGTTTTLNGGGTWQALGKGASKCEKTSSSTTAPYQNSLCAISDTTVDSANYANDCTLCRSYNFTDTGYLLRFDSTTNAWTKAAEGAKVTMSSDVTFKNHPTTPTATRIEPIGGALSVGPIVGSLPDNGRFFITTQQNDLIPCEPFLEPCANTERKSTKLVFEGMQPNDQVNLPATSTDISSSDDGVLKGYMAKIEIPIDLQPIDPVCDSAGFCVPGSNNDWGQSEGNVQVLALRTPQVDTCQIVPFDGQRPLAFLSLSSSPLEPAIDAQQHFVNGVCVGLKLRFDRSNINDVIDQATCSASPIVTLIIHEAFEALTTYTLAPEQPRKASYDPIPGCTREGDTVSCEVAIPVTGNQFIKCSVPAGG